MQGDREVDKREEALAYHRRAPSGKLQVSPTKPCLTQRDLSMAYTPGVAIPCMEIHQRPEAANLYTSRANLVAVVTNGTAVLGLGNIGALAGKPVMEGKAVLFKHFADIDAYDIELDTEDPEELIAAVRLLEPTFGAINLEDIKAPECFRIEQELARRMSIPVFHDDQHGTAIVSGAALLNALELAGKEISEVRAVYIGAGAAAVACSEFHHQLGLRRESTLMCDSTGVIYKGRENNMNPYKQRLATETEARTLAEALDGADVLIGLAQRGTVTTDMLMTMADRPVVFAMANPDPEIDYDEARTARPDAIVATGRSDYPNQVNNVLGFPAIFRGALDTQATKINTEMKIAAVRALARLVKEETPDEVLRAYNMDRLRFGAEYILPKPFDRRVVSHVAPAVAEAAMKTGVAQKHLDLAVYRRELKTRLGKGRQVVQVVMAKAAHNPKRIVFPEGTQDRVLRACRIISEEGIAQPVLVGGDAEIGARLDELNIDRGVAEIVDPSRFGRMAEYIDELHRLRARKGVTRDDAAERLQHRHYFGPMMVRMGDADGLIAGLTHHFSATLRPALQVIGMKPGVKGVAGLFAMMVRGEVLFFADTTVNIDPTAEELADIAIQSAAVAVEFDVEPRIAMLSFSSFGSNRHAFADKMRRAVEILHQSRPDLCVDGEMQADIALQPEMMEEFYPFSRLKGRANVLIFPDLQSASLAQRLVKCLGDVESIGPVLMGLNKPAHLLQHSATVEQIVQMAAVAVVDAQERQKRCNKA